jgi:glycine/D-amino acid oxidase-like deaminating enzyme
MLKITVIGGGAAGFFSAITCAKTYPQARVTLLEAGRQLLAKSSHLWRRALQRHSRLF